MAHNLPKPEGTTSTNYGADFGIYTTALLALRCCQQDKHVSIVINDNKYSPWQDLVLRHQDQTICVLATHESELKDKKKFKASLDQRRKIVEQHGEELVFARLGVAANDALKKQFPKAEAVPEALRLLLTNDSVRHDKSGSTYFCMEQHDVAALESDVEDALRELIGTDVVTKAQLRKVQRIFLEYIHNRFYRLIEADSPMTVGEVRRHLAYIILGLFKVPLTKAAGKKSVSGDFAELLQENVVILNHKQRSAVKDNIWTFLRRVCNQDLAAVDVLWYAGKLHMPISSVDEKSDALILRALQIGEFDAKVLVLRPRAFTFKKIGKTLTILQNLPVDGAVALKVGDEEEVFKRVKLLPDSLAVMAVHRDLFCGLARGLGCNKALVEAHDEMSYVNEEVVVGKEPLTALIAAIKTSGVAVSVIESLIGLGARVNSAVIGGHVPLYFAVQVGRLDVLELLLRNGAEPNLADKYGNVPLFYACMEDKARMVELLLKYKANRYAADFYGVTPVFMAYRVKNYEILKLLLKDNENPTAADVAGYNILHRAAIDGDVKCLQCASDVIRDISVFMVGDVQGHTPLELAHNHNQLGFAETLEKSLKIQD